MMTYRLFSNPALLIWTNQIPNGFCSFSPYSDNMRQYINIGTEYVLNTAKLFQQLLCPGRPNPGKPLKDEKLPVSSTFWTISMPIYTTANVALHLCPGVIDQICAFLYIKRTQARNTEK